MLLLMSISTIISSLAIILLVWHIIRQKQLMVNEATIRTYERLQREVFYDVNYDPQKLSNLYLEESASKNAVKYLDQIEHFCLGVNAGLYSLKLLYKMDGPYIVEQYSLWVPFIVAKRTRRKKMDMYQEFEKVAKAIQRIRFAKMEKSMGKRGQTLGP